jgi:hypothetical protein
MKVSYSDHFTQKASRPTNMHCAYQPPWCGPSQP